MMWTQRERKVGFNEESGVTLLELMFAAGVLATALSMLFASLIGIAAMGRLTQQREAATTYVSTVMEELQHEDFEGLMLYVPPPFEGHGLRQPTVVVECFDADGAPIELPLAVGGEGEGEGEGEPEGGESSPEVDPDDLPNPLEVRTTVIWTNTRGQEFSVSAAALYGR